MSQIMTSGVYIPNKNNLPSQLTSNAMLLTPNGLFYNVRVTRSLPLGITSYNNGTFSTDTAHCLSVGDRIHLDLGCGNAICPVSGNTSICLQVASTPSDTEFTVSDENGNAVNFNSVGTDFTNVWVALAADLTGFEVDVSIYLGENRIDQLLGLAAVPANSSQIQIQGNYTESIKIGDRITVGSFTGTVRATSQVSIKNKCYTIVQTDTTNSSTAIPFTNNNLAFLDATPIVVSGLPTAINDRTTDAWGWLSGGITSIDIAQLNQYIGKTDHCPSLIGRWAISLVWGRQNFPDNVQNSLNNPTWSSQLAGGLLFV